MDYQREGKGPERKCLKMNQTMSPKTRRLLKDTLILGKPSDDLGNVNVGEALNALASHAPMHPHQCPSCRMLQYVILDDRIGDYYRCDIHGEQVRFGPDPSDILRVEKEVSRSLGYRDSGNSRDTILKSELVFWPRTEYEAMWMSGVSKMYPWEDKLGNLLLRALSVLGASVAVLGVAYLAYLLYHVAQLLITGHSYWTP